MRTLAKSFSLVLLGAALTLPTLSMASGPAPAKALLAEASARALKEKKNVLVIFHASWCGWCHKLDDMLESPKFKSTFEKSYVITHVDVMENGPKKNLENEGGADLMAKFGAEKAGLPFFVVLSPAGKQLGDSFLPSKENMGFPSAPEEVSAFMVLLKKTAPKMSAGEQTTVEKFLRAPKAK